MFCVTIKVRLNLHQTGGGKEMKKAKVYRKRIRTVSFFVAFFSVCLLATITTIHALADESVLAGPEERGVTEGVGEYFAITDSDYLNISLHSSKKINLKLQSVPKMIVIRTQASESDFSSEIKISGMDSFTTYHKYEDNYHNYAPILTDENGVFSFEQDVSKDHLIFIQPQKSTKFIKDDASGGDCVSMGSWDQSSKTCTLSQDTNETIQIDNSGITLDGGGHKQSGSRTKNGIYVIGDNVTVKNIVVSGFYYGLYLYNSDSSVVKDVVLENNYAGLNLENSNNNAVLKNTARNNEFYGIGLYNSGGNIISDNFCGPDNLYGISEQYKGGNTYANNVASNNKNTGIRLTQGANDVLEGNNADSNRYYGFQIDRIFPFTMRNNSMSGNGDWNLDISTSIYALSVIDQSNLEDGKPIQYLQNIDGNVFDNTSTGSFYCINCKNLSLKNISMPKGSVIGLYATGNSTIEGIISPEHGTSVRLYYSSSANIIKNNDLKDISINGVNNKIYGNNFWTAYAVSSSSSTSNSFNLPLAQGGGNYWKRNEANCVDGNGDGFCDSAYVFSTRGIDYFPRIAPYDIAPIDPTPEGPSNVLFLPGLEASRLYDDEERLWEPWNSGDVEALYLNKDGDSIRDDIHTKEGDVLDETPVGSNIYKSFIDSMSVLKNNSVINDWKPIAYDWRLSLDEILEDGSIINTLKSLAANSKSGKVTIVAHSNGGLLTKALLKKIGASETQNLVDKIIFVAVPQVGTPEAIGALLHGYDQRILPIFGTKTARGLAENMQGAYNLLPSEGYFSLVQTPVTMFDDVDDESDMKSRYAENINSKDELHDFLADDFRRVSATDTDTDSPAKLNKDLLEKAENLHDGDDGLDSWDAPDGVGIIQIAGWGVSGTLSQTVYGTHDKKICENAVCQSGVDYLDPDFKFVIDGDGTVVTPSALWMGDGEKYWVDLGTYNKNNPFKTIFGFLGVEHKNILEIPTLLSFIEDNVNNSVKPISEYEYLTTTVPPSPSDKRLQYSLHSPLTLDMYAEVDGQTLHTGVNDQGIVEQQIPGTVFKQYGDKKYIFTDEDMPTSIVMKGYAEGKFTFKVEEFQGNDSQGKIEFKDLPTNSQTQAMFSLTSNLESASDLKIDKDGDDDIDWTLEPKIGEIVTLDSIAPTTKASLSGTEGKNGWYVGDVTFTLEAQDNEEGKGIEKTEYSIDSGNAWITYADPVIFSQEGIVEVQYRSIDKQGNVEEAKTITIKIDKAAPEAKIFFDKDGKKLNITGIDNLSQNVVVNTEEKTIKNSKSKHNMWSWGWFGENDDKKIVETATLTDEAGHETKVVVEKKKEKNGFIDASVQSVSYDGQETKLDSNGLQYKWMLNWWRNKYLVFASHIRTQSSVLEAHYLPKFDQTWIMEWPRDLPDDENDNIDRRPVRKKMPGMAIPGIITSNGNIKVIY